MTATNCLKTPWVILRSFSIAFQGEQLNSVFPDTLVVEFFVFEVSFLRLFLPIVCRHCCFSSRSMEILKKCLSDQIGRLAEPERRRSAQILNSI